MSLTQVDLKLLQDQNNEAENLVVEGKIKFGLQCVINEHEITDLYNIFWIKKGKATIKIDFNEFEIKENTIFFLTPGQVFTVISEQHLDGYRLAFGRNFYCLDTHHPEIGCSGVLFNNFLDTPFINLSSEMIPEFEEIMQKIEYNVTNSGIAQSEVVQSYLKIFLIKAANIKKNQQPESMVDENDPKEWLANFNHLVERKYRDWHSVAEYAQELNLSPKSLTKKLAKYGIKPSEIIHDRLILEARRMLHYSNKTIKEITFELGFEDASYFARFFKKKIGYSPSEFAEKHKN